MPKINIPKFTAMEVMQREDEWNQYKRYSIIKTGRTWGKSVVAEMRECQAKINEVMASTIDQAILTGSAAYTLNVNSTDTVIKKVNFMREERSEEQIAIGKLKGELLSQCIPTEEENARLLATPLPKEIFGDIYIDGSAANPVNNISDARAAAKRINEIMFPDDNGDMRLKPTLLPIPKEILSEITLEVTGDGRFGKFSMISTSPFIQNEGWQAVRELGELAESRDIERRAEAHNKSAAEADKWEAEQMEGITEISPLACSNLFKVAKF